jgi:4-hydroxysphinganine ceramide fatty acyl 2-hydroxylase
MIRNFLLHGSNTALILLSAALIATAAEGRLHLSVWLVALGALLFYLSEYGTHRFLFHSRPVRWDWLREKQRRLHYDHHIEPSRIDLLFLPLWYVVPNMLIVGGIAYFILWNFGQVAALLLGATLGLLHYEWVHFIAHQPYTPKTSFGRWMKRYHLRHHFVNEKLWFGVSNPSMDFVYRTYRDLNDATRSKTTKILYPGEQGPG